MRAVEQEKIAVIGLGYVGLPVALSFGRKVPTVGFDIRQKRIDELRKGVDDTREVTSDQLRDAVKLELTADAGKLADCTFYIVAVPTPIDSNNRPDLGPMISASRTVAPHLRKGDVVVFESTVYPGVTEEVCGPILEQGSGLASGVDFFLGYSPERINPGDKEHTFERIVKVVSGQTAETLDRVANVYGLVVEAGVHRAPSIKVAEAAKVIENTQRDLNIALMNELALIFDRMGIRTRDVLAAAATKWNFLKFSPGLVGGHCIGVDPYYLTMKAQQLGYQPEVILAGRRINNGMGPYVAQRLVKLLIQSGASVKGADINVLGLTFKENCPDIRNSRVIDVVQELVSYGANVHVHDPVADPAEARREYGIDLKSWDALPRARAIVAAVAHQAFKRRPTDDYVTKLDEGGLYVDVKCQADAAQFRARGVTVWRL